MTSGGSTVLIAASIVVTTSGSPSGLVRGNVDGDATVNISDVIALLGFLFSGSFDLACEDRGDVDDNGEVNLTDAISLLGYLFLEGIPPAAPFPECGADPTDDPLACVPAGTCG